MRKAGNGVAAESLAHAEERCALISRKHDSFQQHMLLLLLRLAIANFVQGLDLDLPF